MKTYKKIKKIVYFLPMLFLLFGIITNIADYNQAHYGNGPADQAINIGGAFMEISYNFNFATDDNKVFQTVYYAIERVNYNLGMYAWTYWEAFTRIEAWEICMFLMFSCIDVIILPVKYFNKWLNKE